MQHCLRVLSYFLFECCDGPLNGTTSDVALKMGTSFHMPRFSNNANVIRMCAATKGCLGTQRVKLREKFKCKEHIGKSKIRIKTSP